MVQLSIVYSVLALREASEVSGVHVGGSLLCTPPSPPLSGSGRSTNPLNLHTLHTHSTHSANCPPAGSQATSEPVSKKTIQNRTAQSAQDSSISRVRCHADASSGVWSGQSCCLERARLRREQTQPSATANNLGENVNRRVDSIGVAKRYLRGSVEMRQRCRTICSGRLTGHE